MIKVRKLNHDRDVSRGRNGGLGAPMGVPKCLFWDFSRQVFFSDYL